MARMIEQVLITVQRLTVDYNSLTAAKMMVSKVLQLISLALVIFAADAARLRTFPSNDASSEEHNTDDRVSVPYHLVKRLVRYIRLGALGQSISRRTNIPRNEVFIRGNSQYQDTSFSNGDHASHVVRMQHGESLTRVEYTDAYVDAFEFLSHTHRVPAWANLGIGKMIDNIQGDNVFLLSTIDFCADSLSREDREIIADIKQKYLDALDRKISSLAYGEQRSQLSTARRDISNLTPEYLFSQAKKYGLNPEDCPPTQQNVSSWLLVGSVLASVITGIGS